MDWKKTFNRGNWIVHSIFAITVFISLATAFYALSIYDVEKNQTGTNSKITSIIEKLKVDQSFVKMEKFLKKAQAESANDELRKLSAAIAELEELLDVKAGEKLSKSLRVFSNLVNQNSAISNPNEAIKVLKQKINSLKSYAENKNYKNVIRISEILSSKIDQFKSLNSITQNQLNFIKTEFKKLKNLISGSSLDVLEKKNLEEKINSMNGELDLVESLIVHLKDLGKLEKEASLSLGQWILTLENVLKNSQGTLITKKSRVLILISISVSCLLIGWVGIAYLFRWQRIKISDQVESEVKHIIEKAIMEDQRFMTEHYSESTRIKIINLLDELKVKLNLGTMLFEGLPFAACLIDKELKLTWTNKIFLDQFSSDLERTEGNYFGWGQFGSIFCLDGDPVSQAFESKVSGIFGLKVRINDSSPMQPYEMYVNPITVNREERVILFFYPLNSVKDAIKDQVIQAKETIQRFVDLWAEEKLNSEQLNLLEKDFKFSEIEDLYKVFLNFYHRQEFEKIENASIVETLEKENSAYNLVFEEIKKIEDERKDIKKSEIKIIDNIKNEFLTSLDKTDLIIDINKNLLQVNDDFKSDLQKLSTSVQDIFTKNKEATDIISNLEPIKSEYKKIKLELIEIKSKLISSHSTLTSQLPVLDETQQKLVNRYKDELARLEISTSGLDKKLSQLDVLLGKLTYMYDKSNAEQTTFQFNSANKDHELRDSIVKIKSDISNVEEHIVSNFKELHSLIKQDIAKGQAVACNINLDESPINLS